jgi:hypothetical protein
MLPFRQCKPARFCVRKLALEQSMQLGQVKWTVISNENAMMGHGKYEALLCQASEYDIHYVWQSVFASGLLAFMG